MGLSAMVALSTNVAISPGGSLSTGLKLNVVCNSGAVTVTVWVFPSIVAARVTEEKRSGSAMLSVTEFKVCATVSLLVILVLPMASVSPGVASEIALMIIVTVPGGGGVGIGDGVGIGV